MFSQDADVLDAGGFGSVPSSYELACGRLGVRPNGHGKVWVFGDGGLEFLFEAVGGDGAFADEEEGFLLGDGNNEVMAVAGIALLGLF